MTTLTLHSSIPKGTVPYTTGFRLPCARRCGRICAPRSRPTPPRAARRRGATDEEVLAAARAANGDEFVSRLPHGYDTTIGENGARLSIARTLLKDAPVVLLDDATASLDVENETKVQEALSRLLAGKTVIVIAHRMRTVMSADKIVVLEDGRVAEQGSPEELLAAGGLFARMVRLQTESADWTL